MINSDSNTFLSCTNHLSAPLTSTINMQTSNIQSRNINACCLASPTKLLCPHCDRTFSSIRGCKQHLRAVHPMPTRNMGAGGVLSDHQPSPLPPSSPCSQTSSRPLSPSPLVGVPSAMGSNSPTGSAATLSHSESEWDQHLDIPSMPITRNYRATVEESLMMKTTLSWNIIPRHLNDHLAWTSTLTLGGFHPIGAQVLAMTVQISILRSPKSHELIILT